MTRENKLALIIGFGLILVVGILVSDHFSLANTQTSANLSRNQPIDAQRAPVRLSNPELLVPRFVNRDKADPSTNPSPGTDPEAWTRETRHDPGSIIMPGQDELIRSEGITTPPRMSAENGRSFRWRTIRANESLWSIAREEYGDEHLWKRLAEVNADRIPNPDRIRAGVLIRIPPKSELADGTTAGPASTGIKTPAQVRPRYRKHTVKAGENLSKLAKKYLGSGKKWRELWDLNREVIRYPDHVPVGTVIRVPG